MKQKKLRCLVITPFDAGARPLRDTIRRTLEVEDVDVVIVDKPSPGLSVINAITEAISSADFLVADITRQNPNVMYELGFAHALRKPTVLIQSTEAQPRVPSDLSGQIYFTYDPTNFKSFSDDLSHAVVRFKRQAKA